MHDDSMTPRYGMDTTGTCQGYGLWKEHGFYTVNEEFTHKTELSDTV